MSRWFSFVLLVCLCCAVRAETAPPAPATAAELGLLLAHNELDPEACYRVNDLKISREDVSVYLTSGYLILAKKVNGVRPAALFSADVDAGDAEVVVMPPNRGERLSLASFTESPNLDEHFRAGLMVFSDNTGAELERQVEQDAREHGGYRRDSNVASQLAGKWNETLRTLSGNFTVRMVQDMLSPGTPGFFFLATAGTRLGSFDILYDPTIPDQIILGQVSERNQKTYFDVWTAFAGRAARASANNSAWAPLRAEDYRIEADLDDTLGMRAVTRVKVTPADTAGRALPFLISARMRVTEVRIDGVAAEVYQKPSLHAGPVWGGNDEVFLVVPAAPLKAGQSYEFEFHHEGNVITESGKGMYFVGARGTWYPHPPVDLTRFDLTFHFPKALDLVATGDVVEKRTGGDRRTLRFRSGEPIRFAGFNLGRYQRKCISRDGFRIEVCANTPDEANPVGITETAPRMEAIANEVIAALQFMTSQYGPPPVHSLTVSPIPTTFGQGFPGLIYLSTLAYLNPEQRPKEARADEYTEFFFSELMAAHETAHQWWGNLVSPATSRDDWLMEALANYSALMYLEKKKGRDTLDKILEDYRRHLMVKAPDGREVESAGPVTWGLRLSSSQFPDAWRVITYEKGSWIIHMLRVRLGDERFRAFLAELCRRYRFQALTTDQFRRLAAQYLPPGSRDPALETFFDAWVYGTGIPILRLKYAIRGTRVTGTVEQSGVPDDFSALAPVGIRTGPQKTVVEWVETGSDPTQFSRLLTEKPLAVALQPENTLATIQR
ncbi:MAG: M1 family aminopeptidase [Bryobacteraceae bacterium]